MKKLSVLIIGMCLMVVASSVNATYYQDEQEATDFVSNERGWSSLTAGQRDLVREIAGDWQYYKTILQEPEEETFGSSLAISSPVAFFETSLQSSITTTATSMTLVSALDKHGTTLASSTYAFVIDEGTSKEEMVKCDCTGTACTNCDRGLSVLTGTTTVTAAKKAHRRGASVKITNAPLLINLTRIINGIGTIPNVLSYTSAPTFTAGNYELVTYDAATAMSNQGAATSSLTVAGIAELATGLEAASTTEVTDNPYVLHTGIATSTSDVAGNHVVITNIDGKFDQSVLDLDEEWIHEGALTSNGLLYANATTSVAGVVASSTTVNPLQLNGVDTNWPSSAPTVSTSSVVMDTDGTVRYTKPAPEILFQDGASYTTTAQATTSLITYVMPANTMGIDSRLEIYANCSKGGANAVPVNCGIELGTGAATATLIYFAVQMSAEDLTAASLHSNVSNRGSLAVQRGNSHFLTAYNNSGGAVRIGITTTETTYNTATQLYINFIGWSGNANTTAGVDSITITKY